MKNDRSIFFFAFVLTILGSPALMTSETRAAEEDYIARAVSVSGKVLARGESGGSVQMTFLKPGDKLYKGSIVNTGSSGAVKLLMTDRTILDLGPSSLFKMNDYQLKKGEVGNRKVDLSLDYGTVRASVNEKLTTHKAKFTIRTKAATMGVRGTEFVVSSPIPAKDASGTSVEPPKMSLTVMHGKVEVANAKAGGSPVAVTPGYQFAKSGDGKGQMAQLGTAEVAKIKSDAFQKDLTFMQAVTFDANTSKASNESSSAKEEAKNEGKVDGKDGAKTDAKGDAKTAESAPASGGNHTLADIGTNIETQSKEAPKPMIGDLKLPGTFTPEIPQQRPIDQLNGRLVNLKVRICPVGGC